MQSATDQYGLVSVKLSNYVLQYLMQKVSIIKMYLL